MKSKRLALLAVGCAALALAMVISLVGPCSIDVPAPPDDAPEDPRPLSVPRRRGERPSTDYSSPPGSASSATARDADPAVARSAVGRVRVRVTREDRPVAGVQVWLLPLLAGDTTPDVPNTQWSDGAYFGVPRHLGLAEHCNAARSLVSATALHGAPSRTGDDGTVELTASGGAAYTVLVGSEYIVTLIREAPVVRPVAGQTVEVALTACTPATIAGRCRDESGSPVVQAMVQAFDPGEERAVSALVSTDVGGEFALEVDSARPSVRLRVVAPRQLPMCDSEAALPATLDDAVLEGVIPGGPPLDVRLPRVPSVVLELTSDVPFGHLQVEELVLDETAQVWGRLGGPVYSRNAAKAADPRRAFVALARADAQRPLMLWTWGGPPELSGVDVRGRWRAKVHLPRGRKLSVNGKGWLPGDRLRVVCRIGLPGEEFPGVWVENPVTTGSTWMRDDTPPCEIELRLVRDGRETGPRPRAPAGSEDVTVQLDL